MHRGLKSETWQCHVSTVEIFVIALKDREMANARKMPSAAYSLVLKIVA
jgi:hypothetical protein